MLKIKQPVSFIEGKLHLHDRVGFALECKEFGTCEGFITIEKDNGAKTPKQHGYYWGVLVPHTLIILRDECGYLEWRDKTKDHAHEFLKYLFCPIMVMDRETGELIRLPGTTKTMSRDEKIKYIEDIIFWGFDKFNYTYPPPRNKADKYEL